ncbi:hypothetical protein MAP00_001367 [Monascus purpureus]|nr:hypothetical protein MAP00_001367 [Monascus purpureus]
MAYNCNLAVITQSDTSNFVCSWSKADRAKGSDNQIHQSIDVILYPKQSVDSTDSRFTGPDNGGSCAVCYDED